MFDLTLFLAQVMGVYLLVAGVSGLLYPARTQKAMREFNKSTVLPYFDGALALILGLLILFTHNVWDDLTTSLVTLVGWLAVLEGLAMFLLSEDVMKQMTNKIADMGRIIGVVAVVAGAYLMYAGFFG